MAVNWAPFSEKAIDAIVNSNAFINILEGAVRSSKTLCSIISWLAFLEQSPHTKFLMTGKTADTLYRNVLDGDTGILAIMGKKRARYVKSSQGGARLVLKFGKVDKVCYCVGAHNEGSEGRIRGMTIGGWYADEVTLYPESFVKQAINRMSLDGARAYWTTNPDTPYHYIKTEFIDKAQEKGYKTWQFMLDDNLALGEAYKSNLKRAYSGLWYRRMVLGEWVAAEGAIYDMFDPDVHIIDCPTQHELYGAAIDYATSSVATFGLFGETGDDVHLLKEYYWDAVQRGRQKTNGELADDLVMFLGKTRVRYIYVDPSAAGLILELRKRGLPVYPAINDVLEGIRLVSRFLAERRFFVDRSCKDTIRETLSYVWDPKAQKEGEDRPLKQQDHAVDRNRYYLYSRFGRPHGRAVTLRHGGK